MRSTAYISPAMLLLTVSLGAQQAQTPQPPAYRPDFVIPKPEGPASAVPQQQQPTVGDQYVIGPADTLAITVVDELDLTRKYLVDTDGTITMPYIGRQQAAGLTVEALRAKITAEL